MGKYGRWSIPSISFARELSEGSLIINVSEIALQIGKGLHYVGLILSPLLLIPLLILIWPTAFRYAQRPMAFINALGGRLLDIAGWAGFVMALGMLAAVLVRYVFGQSFGWLKDIWIYAFAACFMLASAGALKTGAHVRVDIFFANFTPKQRAIVDLLGTYLFLFPLMILILDSYAPQLARAWGAMSGRMELSSEPDGLPLLFLFKTLVPIFAVTMILQAWSNAVKSASILKGNSPDNDPAASNSVVS